MSYGQILLALVAADAMLLTMGSLQLGADTAKGPVDRFHAGIRTVRGGGRAKGHRGILHRFGLHPQQTLRPRGVMEDSDMTDILPDHSHCINCDDPIPVDEKFCSDLVQGRV